MKLEEHDHVVGAWAEMSTGHGWANQLIWVCIRNAFSGHHRVEALQPDEQTKDMRAIFPICAAASAELLAAVQLTLGDPNE